MSIRVAFDRYLAENMRYFMELSYRGTAYNGWQIQQNAPSIQATIQDSMALLLRQEISVVGAGRTDTGVHAFKYVLHFDASSPLDDVVDFVYHLNSILPDDIAIRSIRAVKDDAHARFDAQLREYKYYITPHKEPFRRDMTWQYHLSLDKEAMNEAANMLLGEGDFTTFCKLHSDNKTNLCNVSYARWERADDGGLMFTIRSNRFLRNMIRSLVGTMVDVGRNKLTVSDFERLYKAKDNALASSSAPAHGLFMTDIQYPDKIYL